MSIVESPPRLFDEIADLFAACPDHEAVLTFKPSEAVQARARDLLEKQTEHQLAADEQLELTELEQAELLMRLVKARVRASAAE